MTQALYYPTIEFQDIESLKKSLLLWDRVCRIVPQNYSPEDSAKIKEASSHGVIFDIFVDGAEKSAAAHKFLDFYAKRNSPDHPLVWPAGFSSTSFTRLNPSHYTHLFCLLKTMTWRTFST